MGYADLDRCQRQLMPNGQGEFSEEALSDLMTLDTSMTRALELKLGRSWSAEFPATEARPIARHREWSAFVPLPAPIRSLTNLVVDGEAVADVLLDFGTAYRAPDGVWEYLYVDTQFPVEGNGTLTAGWADRIRSAPPAEIVEAVNALVVGFYRRDEGGIVGSGEVEIGLNGEGGTVRDPWRDPRVRMVTAPADKGGWVLPQRVTT